MKHENSNKEETANSDLGDVSGSLPTMKDWTYIQEQAYDECMNKLINDDAPITAFIEWLQKRYPNGVAINYN